MAIRSSMSNYKQEDWLTNVPLYMLAEYFEKNNICGKLITIYLKTNGGFFCSESDNTEVRAKRTNEMEVLGPFTAM